MQNYLVPLDYALAQLKSLPVSSRLMRGVHARLLQGVRGSDQNLLEFRDIQV